MTVKPGGGNATHVLLAEAVLASASSTVDFTGIPATYDDLELVVHAAHGGGNLVSMRFNGDTAANYDMQQLRGIGTSAAALEILGAAEAEVGRLGSDPGVIRATIPNYASTTLNKAFDATSSQKTGTTTGLLRIYQTVGFWRSTAAINRIWLSSPVAGGFVVGSTFRLYGKRG